MSRVNWDAAASWLARESIVSLPSSSSSDVPTGGSFDQHLAEAQKTAVASNETSPETPAPRPTSHPSQSRPSDCSQRSSSDDRPEPAHRENADADSRPAPSAENHATSSSPHDADNADQSDSQGSKEKSPGDHHDAEKDKDHASDAAAAAGAAAAPAQPGQSQAQQASPQAESQATEAVVLSQDHGKPASPLPAMNKPPDKSGKIAAKASSGAAQRSKAARSPAAVQAAAKSADSAADKAVATGDGDAAAGSAADSTGQGQPAAVAPVEVVAKAPGGEASAAKDASSANPASAAEAVQPIEGTAEAVSAASVPPAEDAAQGQKSSSGAGRAGQRSGQRTSGRIQAASDAIQAAAGEDATPDAVKAADSEDAGADLPAAKDGSKAPAGNRPTDSPQDAKVSEPASAGHDGSTRASETGAQQNEETAKSDAAERARFVQRVARAFESAADQAGHIRLRLSPPELGSLRLDLTIRDGHMSARMETETESARNMLLDNLPALKDRLADHHIQVESFDIEWQGQSQGGLSQRSQDQSRWQSPAGYVPRVSDGGQGNAGAPAAGVAARRVSSGTSFDVVI